MHQHGFLVDDRVCTLQPVGWLNRGSYGTVVRVFFGLNIYGVRFDNQTSVHVVRAQELEYIELATHIQSVLTELSDS